MAATRRSWARAASLLALLGLLLVVTLSIVVARQGSSQTPAAAGRVPVVIDTDADSDDAIAILYLLRHPRVDVRAITVTGAGFQSQVDGVPIVQRLAALAGRGDVPVSYGAPEPIAGVGAFPEAWVAAALDGYRRARLPTPERSPSRFTSQELLARAIDAAPRPPVVVALGPVTNVARALSADPTLATRVERVVISGGAFFVDGNLLDFSPRASPNARARERELLRRAVVRNDAEYNAFLDPAAIALLLDSGAPVTFAPLDVTEQVVVTERVVERLRGGRSEVAGMVTRALRTLLDQHGPSGPPTYLWDPAVAAIAIDGAMCSRERDVRVAIETDPEGAFGRTRAEPGGQPARICLRLDVERFLLDVDARI